MRAKPIDKRIISAAEKRYDRDNKDSESKLDPLYRKAARVLATNMSRKDFLKLQELIDGDPSNGMYDAITVIAAEADPKNFTQPGEDPMDKSHKK